MAEQTFSHYPALPPPLKVRLTVLDAQPCVYLPRRTSQMRGLWVADLDPQVLQGFLDRGFRRSGGVLYQPMCAGCRACTPLRIDVGKISYSKGQRRVLRRNADLQINVAPPNLTQEKYNLYIRYLEGQHADGRETTFDELQTFLYASPTTTLEVEYRTAQRELVGVGICDVGPDVLSSVYFYWAPNEKQRSLGLLSALNEIQLTQRMRRRWYHLGYWVRGAETMHYKATIADHELLGGDGVWRASVRQVDESRTTTNDHDPPYKKE